MTASTQTPVAHSSSGNLRAIAAMVVSMLVFSLSDVMMKLVGSQLPVGQLLMLRGVVAAALILLLICWNGLLPRLGEMLRPKLVWRSLAEAICSILYFVALVQMTLGDIAAISQFAPLAVMAGAALLLNEPVGWRRWTAAAVGFFGVLLIVKPGTSAFQPASLIMLASMVFVAMRDLITRRLEPGASNLLVTFAAIIAVTAFGAGMLPFETWHVPRPSEWLMLIMSAVAVIAGFMLGLDAMRTGDIGTVQPFRYSFMLFAMLLGFVVFGDMPDHWSLAGVLLIVGSGLYSLHRERVRRAEARK